MKSKNQTEKKTNKPADTANSGNGRDGARLDNADGYTVNANLENAMYEVRRLKDWRKVNSFLNSADAVDYCDQLNEKKTTRVARC